LYCFKITTFSKIDATVTGPTQPGTGVIAFTLSFTFSKFISQTGLQFTISHQTSINIWDLSSLIKFSSIK
jgi:hypothetical protein